MEDFNNSNSLTIDDYFFLIRRNIRVLSYKKMKRVLIFSYFCGIFFNAFILEHDILIYVC